MMVTQVQTSKAMKLSPEIVSEIFNNFSTTMTIHNPHLYPWFLGQICAGWRNVFLSPSTRYIEINVSKFYQRSASFERVLDILNFCLKCSEGCPLSFTFRMGTDYYAGEYAYVVDILNALITQSMRWVTAEFFSLPIIELRRLHCVKGRIPLLRSFVLTHRTIKPPQEVISNVFEQAPTLKRLLLSDINVSKFHWASIESFRLGSLTDAASRKLVAALSQATSLKELEIGWEDINRRSINVDMEKAGNVTLPSLKRLVLHAHNIFEALTAPGLEHLTVNFQGGRNQNQIKTSISSFIHRSSCPLKHLSLWYADTEVTVEVLSGTPGLSSLLLHDNCDGIRRAIKSLNCDIPEGASLIAPRLKSLEMEVPWAEPNTLSMELSAMHMVASRARNPGVDGLQELSFRTDSTKPGDLIILQWQCEQHNVKLTVGELGESPFPI